MRNRFPQLPISIAISKLLLVGANPNLAEDGEESALILAIKNGLFEAADELIRAGANVNHIGVDGNNAAHACCKLGLCLSYYLCVNIQIVVDRLMKNEVDDPPRNVKGQRSIESNQFIKHMISHQTTSSC